ncbi:MAG: hypothetical protein QM539_10695 [Alphaproteobacteria bacterium]|nr:hypothetical protein [Alphaproteobacteria bacterium]
MATGNNFEVKCHGKSETMEPKFLAFSSNDTKWIDETFSDIDQNQHHQAFLRRFCIIIFKHTDFNLDRNLKIFYDQKMYKETLLEYFKQQNFSTFLKYNQLEYLNGYINYLLKK